MSNAHGPYPVVDLFAGPGGLGEGFATLKRESGSEVFRSLASIERNEHAHATLTLRHFFRCFNAGEVPDEYYQYIRGEISREELAKAHSRQWSTAQLSSLRLSLEPENHQTVQSLIHARLGDRRKWALVGGPPCQAYSLVGRSRMGKTEKFKTDERHFLYQEYLRIIVDHRPPVFVMENVKGLLSSKVDDELIVHRIFSDLRRPKCALNSSDNGLRYRLYSLSSRDLFASDLNPAEFVVRAEQFGVPQARHRMFILGVRDDLDIHPSALTPSPPHSTAEVIGAMPRIRSGVSKAEDSLENWRAILRRIPEEQWFQDFYARHGSEIQQRLKSAIKSLDSSPARRQAGTYKKKGVMLDWFYDERIGRLTQHESRSHMPGDLHRYLFASVFAKAHGRSPKLRDFPMGLLPAHHSARSGKNVPAFEDRFRVQLADRPSTTITSHISKDGHYFIHFDPSQCRSLTVREAARLQTFPDNYFFEGPRTAQYHQVGNAVPPYLAMQISQIVGEILDAMPED